MAEDSITGYTVIEAADLDEAEAIAKECPIVASTRGLRNADPLGLA